MSRSDEQQTSLVDPQLHSTFTDDDEVRTEDRPEALEQAAPTHSGQENVNHILEEAQVVGGSDNTARPAGGNGDPLGDRENLDRVTQSDMAQQNYANETTTDPGISAT